jgi:hypothetical protein
MPLHFHEGQLPSGEKYQSVGHPIETGADELWADATDGFNNPHKFLL